MRQEPPVRKKNRLEDYDYSSEGKYFVTICISDRVHLLWEDEAEHGEYWELSKYGKVVNEEIQRVDGIYQNVSLDLHCIMPEHIHMIISIDTKNCRGELCSPVDSPALSRIIKQFKRCVTKRLGFSIWQKTYYDRIIRNQDEYDRIRKYIEENPLKRLLGETDQNSLTFLE